MIGVAPENRSLTRFAWLTIAAAVATIGLKAGAYLLTGSVGLLSDALESVVNLVAGIATLVALWVAAREPDEEHAYGHTKAEYFSSGLEGLLILVAAGSIIWAAITRLIDPVPIERVGAGLIVSLLATVVNGGVAWLLFRAGDRYRSIALRSNARHLMTDVWTSVGVVVAVGLVAVTGWNRLDPVIALIVAANISWSGAVLVNRSVHGLLDTALDVEDSERLEVVLARYRERYGVRMHALRTRQAGTRRFMSVHVLVPGEWTVRRGHDLLDQLEHDLRQELPDLTVMTHLEPLEDPASWDDMHLDRGQRQESW
ncbi:MAG TPA: cation diffusion facilitator family transporter [Thermomicrobiales bacterium]|nr:cation diffusion facilitator family transporter [Thermomicrobiales bacterium]